MTNCLQMQSFHSLIHSAIFCSQRVPRIPTSPDASRLCCFRERAAQGPQGVLPKLCAFKVIHSNLHPVVSTVCLLLCGLPRKERGCQHVPQIHMVSNALVRCVTPNRLRPRVTRLDSIRPAFPA